MRCHLRNEYYFKLANRTIIEIISEYTLETGQSEIDTNRQF